MARPLDPVPPGGVKERTSFPFRNVPELVPFRTAHQHAVHTLHCGFRHCACASRFSMLGRSGPICSRPAVRRPPSKISRNFRDARTEKTGAVEAPPSRTETPRTKLEVRRTRGRGGGRGPGRSASRAPTICHRAFDSSKTVGARTPCSREVHATSSVADFRVQGGRPPGAPPRDAPSCFTNFG